MKSSQTRLRRTVVFAVFAFCLIFAVTQNRAADIRNGQWTIGKSDNPARVEFSLSEHHHGGNSNDESDWPTSSFPGIDFSKSGRQDVRFVITRDAGKIECEGFLNNGEGAGVFHFSPDPNYVREMKALDFTVDEDQQYGMAVHDVSLEFARQMKSKHLASLDTDKLVAFRIHGVDAAFIDDVRAAGLKISDSDQLVAFRIHGVTPGMIRSVHQAGYSPDEDMLIAMRIHGATPEWLAELNHRGYQHVDLDQLMAFRIHDVSPEFIGKIQGLGYTHPEPDELVAMRIHNVTPEFISNLRSRGMQNLSIDQLIDMRIHGID
jgi:hypothetical protein